MARTKEEQIADRLKEMPETCRSHYRKAMRGRSQRSAITAQCLECVGWVRNEVELCTDSGCPLYPFRPFQVVPWKAHKSASKGNLSALRAARTPVESTVSD
ncbi:hypothetical protein LCGC14_2169840 [marine sediment metagenome]|uniref:Uncharacterized protein n=1 Tax=marine sediment metagenome TaxID=412755 RepID=A0A0F9DQ81_9ZZZZ